MYIFMYIVYKYRHTTLLISVQNIVKNGDNSVMFANVVCYKMGYIMQIAVVSKCSFQTWSKMHLLQIVNTFKSLVNFDWLPSPTQCFLGIYPLGDRSVDGTWQCSDCTSSLERYILSPSIAMSPSKCVCIHASVPPCIYHRLKSVLSVIYLFNRQVIQLEFSPI